MLEETNKIDTAFVIGWIENWNRRDLESILAHYASNIEFTSPKALQIAGAATLRGKEALRAYWTAALQHIRDLHFVLDHWTWDAEKRELLIVYNARLNGTTTRACEMTRFGSDGLAIYGEAMYGASIQ